MTRLRLFTILLGSWSFDSRCATTQPIQSDSASLADALACLLLTGGAVSPMCAAILIHNCSAFSTRLGWFPASQSRASSHETTTSATNARPPSLLLPMAASSYVPPSPPVHFVGELTTFRGALSCYGS